jgi:aminoglycoside phosphotransferase
VAVDPVKDDLAVAAEALRAAGGGQIYVELTRRLARSHVDIAVREVLKWLRELAFAATATHWHYPAFANSRAIVPLAERSAYAYALARRESEPLQRLKARAAAIAGPVVPLVASRSISIVANLGTVTSRTAAGTALSAASEAAMLARFGLGGGFSEVLVTPIAETSTAVLSVLVPRRSRRPVLIAKQPRLPERSALEREAANLQALRAAWPAATFAAPESLGLFGEDDAPILVQTALDGRGLEPAELRRSRRRVVDDVVRSLIDLGAESASPAAAVAGRYKETLQRPLETHGRFATELRGARELVSRSIEATEELRRASIPLVFEHGDVAHSNVLRLRSGGVGFVDWELAQPQGLPLQDLFFFIGYVAFTCAGSKTTEERLAAFDDVFLERDGWASKAVAAYADRLHLPPASISPLFIACWARYAAGFRHRLLGCEPGDSRPATSSRTEASIEALMEPWYALWRRALEVVDRLPWTESVARH